ncbi:MULTISPECIES: UDP-galactopyranose mutase [unclassified Brenneria]|uniref:UDP-galactopyranose mutase n=1 Tax=unclassified Brenneria TaxID=2634434 RepID=UPI0029C4C186|nr:MULTISPECIES: UDP-galactopyranose mutase [unclassified Brenneria]MDX5627794.1 UDP-galactopyranose mutase [Brenneria sp. L3-3Z]MDX5695115.1 UDP-galactopyranose mutase [Brenneria sp. L4-2C]
MQYDYIIVGSGLFGSVCAYELKKKGNKVLVLEKKNHIGGNVYTENNNGIQVHKYGAHIFHTNDKAIWEYVNSFVEFNRFTNSPLAFFDGKLFNLPFNMNTFYQLWGCKTPKEAKDIIDSQRDEMKDKEPQNLEEQAISLVGRDIYEKFIKGYTEKQWGRKATELPTFIINRLPVRMVYDNNYFLDRYQGIPIGGYTALIDKMLEGIDVKLNVDFLKTKDEFTKLTKSVIYTGAIDEYFDYCYGCLEYRSLYFDTQTLDIENYQGNAVINYTSSDVPFTRIIEHKHFDMTESSHTVITKEYPKEWKLGDDAYYPINDNKNMRLYKKYRSLSNLEKGVFFGGRLAEYKYYDMHQVIRSALNLIKAL